MRSLAAFRDGIRRVSGAPVLVVGMAAVTFFMALPLSIALRGMIDGHLGKSLVAESAASPPDYAWWQEFQSQAAGLGQTFQPSIIGFGAVLDNISGLLDNVPLAATITGVTAAWMVVWSFLSGGVLDRLARDRPTRSHGFFRACGIHFWRFARVGLIAGLLYYLLFAVVHGWIFDDLYSRWTRDVTVERTAFLIWTGGYLAFGLLLILLNLLLDYARIRIVVEDRRSALGALVAAARFIRRRFGRIVTLYCLNACAFLALVAVYAFVTAAPLAGWWMWVTLVAGQVFILLRHYLKLVFYASETALFEGNLVHAPFTAPPLVLWPESPAAERIGNAESVSYADRP